MLTESEQQYVTVLKEEFGEAFGTNLYPPPEPLPSLPRLIKHLPTVPLSGLTDGQKTEILQQRLKHVPYKVVAEAFNITYMTIWQIQRDAGYSYENGNQIG